MYLEQHKPRDWCIEVLRRVVDLGHEYCKSILPINIIPPRTLTAKSTSRLGKIQYSAR